MRESSQIRETTETKIKLSLQLDEGKNVSVQTGVGFFDHMLTLFARHGRFGLQVEAEGDVFVDAHHTVEDVGLVLGDAFKKALSTDSKSAFGGIVACNRPLDMQTAKEINEVFIEVINSIVSGNPHIRFTNQVCSNDRMFIYRNCIRWVNLFIC